ncbi:MAG: 50S ribosomal protein L24 [Methanomassiliicoccales archaeon]|nr:MAG: 50S ribosomal protein L24 [Methanomassiliicoccales archaeon]
MAQDSCNCINDSVRTMTKTKKPGKQRKRQWEAPLHQKRKMMRAHLAPKYLEAGKRRSFTIRKGDLVRIMRGEFKDEEGKVEKVDLAKMVITIEKITQAKADESQAARQIHPSNVMIIKPDMSDRRRLVKFGRVIEEEEFEEEELEEEEAEESEEETTEEEEE